MSTIMIPDPVRKLLRDNLIDEQDLIRGIGHEELSEIAGRPGWFRCTCTLALRRPLDPETAELKRLGVTLRQIDSGSWEVDEVEGLEPATQ